MDRRLGLVVAAAALAAGTAAAGTQGTFRIQLPEGRARVVVPRRFEPLLPGSVYPDKRKMVEALHLPVAALDRRLAARGRKFLLERGFRVVETPAGGVKIAALKAGLAGYPEADTSRIVVWGEGSVTDTAGAAALALFSPVPPETLGKAVIEKWYG